MLHLVDEEEVIGQTNAHHREPQFFAGDWTQQEDKAVDQVTMPCGHSREASGVTVGRDTWKMRRQE